MKSSAKPATDSKPTTKEETDERNKEEEDTMDIREELTEDDVAQVQRQTQEFVETPELLAHLERLNRKTNELLHDNSDERERYVRSLMNLEDDDEEEEEEEEEEDEQHAEDEDGQPESHDKQIKFGWTFSKEDEEYNDESDEEEQEDQEEQRLRQQYLDPIHLKTVLSTRSADSAEVYDPQAEAEAKRRRQAELDVLREQFMKAQQEQAVAMETQPTLASKQPARLYERSPGKSTDTQSTTPPPPTTVVSPSPNTTSNIKTTTTTSASKQEPPLPGNSAFSGVIQERTTAVAAPAVMEKAPAETKATITKEQPKRSLFSQRSQKK
jgi:hypothetical protein